MKRRNGHVSNSSSSSFIIIGKSLEPSKVTKKDLKNKDVRIVGKYLNDGTDLIKLKPEMFDFVQDSYHLTNQTWIEISSMHYSEGDEAVALPKSEDDLFIWAVEVDDHSTDDIETITSRYEDL